MGNLGFTINPKRRHATSLGMGVKDNHAGSGVGSALLETVIDLADNWLNLKRIELTVFVDNEQANASRRIIHVPDYSSGGSKLEWRVSKGERYYESDILGVISYGKPSTKVWICRFNNGYPRIKLLLLKYPKTINPMPL